MDNPIQDIFETLIRRSQTGESRGIGRDFAPIQLGARASSDGEFSAASEPTLSDREFKLVAAYVSRNIDGPLRVRELAAEVGLSASHFSRAFTTRLGKSPYAFVMEQRMLHACHLMLNTGQRLTEIAGNCGLSDQAHLTRLFRRFEGTTPARWRRLRRGALVTELSPQRDTRRDC
ncbi:helix-turn-helix domain-containing protein [Ensifer canadensis]